MLLLYTLTTLKKMTVVAILCYITKVFLPHVERKQVSVLENHDLTLADTYLTGSLTVISVYTNKNKLSFKMVWPQLCPHPHSKISDGCTAISAAPLVVALMYTGHLYSTSVTQPCSDHISIRWLKTDGPYTLIHQTLLL